MSDQAVVPDGEDEVNLKALEPLWELDPGGTLFRNVIETYLTGASNLVTDFLKAAQDNDQEAMIRAAHALKSSSAYVGAERVSSMCLNMVTNLQSGWSCRQEVIDRFNREHEAAVKKLRQILAANTATTAA